MIIIGISGKSASGKSTVAQMIAKQFNGTLISIDQFYYSEGKELNLVFEKEGKINWDDPKSIRSNDLINVITKLKCN